MSPPAIFPGHRRPKSVAPIEIWPLPPLAGHPRSNLGRRRIYKVAIDPIRLRFGRRRS
jgi:hypothetical protein